jgi:hypothetical protein
MEMTRDFWNKAGSHEKLCSNLTLDEIGRASPELAEAMQRLTGGLRVVQLDDQTDRLARIYVQEGVVAQKYFADALHIAAAVLADADILVSWNFEHLVKRATRFLVNSVNAKHGLRTIEILAPEI